MKARMSSVFLAPAKQSSVVTQTVPLSFAAMLCVSLRELVSSV